MRFADRVKETTTTTGTGSITLLGAVAQFETFTANFITGERFYYAIVGQSGTEWECGFGSLSGAATLARTDVLQSSNADALVSFTAGTKDVYVTIPSVFANATPTIGVAMALSGGNIF